MALEESNHNLPNQSILAAVLLLEKQLVAAYRWQYEWSVLSLLGVSALVAVAGAVGTRVDPMSLLGIAVLIISGYRLASRERKRFYQLRNFYMDMYASGEMSRYAPWFDSPHRWWRF